MQGDVTVKSVAGRGSKFSLLLPVSSEAGVLSEPSVGAGGEVVIPIRVDDRDILQGVHPMCECKQVLVVDDTDTNLLVVKGMLQQLNVKCDVARSGKEALDIVSERNAKNRCCPDYRLILMDCCMPGMSGFDAASFMRGLDRFHAHIVALTGECTEDFESFNNADLFEGIRNFMIGIMIVVCKPVNSKRLREALCKYHVL